MVFISIIRQILNDGYDEAFFWISPSEHWASFTLIVALLKTNHFD